MPANANDSLSLRIAIVEQGDRGKARNTTIEWKALKARLSKPAIDQNHTVVEYKELTVDKKNKLKDVGAYVGGPVKDGIRKRENMIERTIVTLDIDSAFPSDISELQFGLSPICGFEWFASTTRSHTPERPKWRLLLPLSRPVTADEYAPLARILASMLLCKLAAAMDATDDVSYRVAQIMYWPSVNKDGKFGVMSNSGSIVNPDQVLTNFGNWQDWTQLPYSEKRGQKRPSSTKKAELPTAKRGIVGAFCRAYDVPAAIKKFIPEVYLPGDKHSKKARYTYAKGQGANGAVVEDDGLFLYSHHGTDPCGERLVNAFDMVRLHVYGDLDKGEEFEGPKSAPSYKAMTEAFVSDAKVSAELVKDQFDADAMFEDQEPGDDIKRGLPATAKKKYDLLLDDEPAPTIDWMTALDKEDDGSIKPTLTNIVMIIQNDRRMNGIVEINKFTDELVTRTQLRSKMDIIPKMPVEDKVNGDLWSDRHDACIRAIIEAPRGKGRAGYGLKVSDRDLKDAVDIAAAKSAFHPVRDYLNGVKWDGKARAESLFVKYLSAPDNAYTRAIARMMLLGAVVRIFEPGHKFDFVVILEGLQGKRKSTFISILAHQWFVEIEGDLSDRKQLVEKMQGAWILEIPELSGFGKAEVQEIKAFVSAQKDKVRLAYDRRGRSFKRQCIFIGSTNDSQYLRDPTGGRRFWPVVCHTDEINTDMLLAEVDQIWAEAVTFYHAMRKEHPNGTLPLYLTNAQVKAEALEMQESRRVETAEDAMAGQIDEWLSETVTETQVMRDATGFDDLDNGETLVRRTEVSLLELWVEALHHPRREYNETAARMLGRAIRLLKDWHVTGIRKTARYGKQNSYRRVGAYRFPCEPVIDI